MLFTYVIRILFRTRNRSSQHWHVSLILLSYTKISNMHTLRRIRIYIAQRNVTLRELVECVVCYDVVDDTASGFMWLLRAQDECRGYSPKIYTHNITCVWHVFQNFIIDRPYWVMNLLDEEEKKSEEKKFIPISRNVLTFSDRQKRECTRQLWSSCTTWV